MHISAHLDLDVVAVESDDTVTVLLELTAPQAVEDLARPAQTVVVVLDRSGSMGDGRLEAAKDALMALVDRLDDADWFGLVVFDDTAGAVVPAGVVAKLGRDSIRAALRGVQPGGSTDISSGYLRGLHEAVRVRGESGVTIILVSDGHANTGIVDPHKLRALAADAAAHGIVTASIGVGTGYDEVILSEIAIGGTGNHSFAEEADAAGAAIAAELDGLLSKTVQAASLLVRPTSAVTSLTVLNDLPAQAVPGGLLVEVGDFYGGEQRQLLFGVGVPAMAALGLAQVAQFELSYVALPQLESQTVTIPVSVNVVPQNVAEGRVPNAVVTRQRLLIGVQEAKRTSERALRDGNIESARRLLHEARDQLRCVPDPDDMLADDVRFLDETLADLERRGVAFSAHSLSAHRTKVSRGYSSRSQGGRVDPEGHEQT